MVQHASGVRHWGQSRIVGCGSVHDWLLSIHTSIFPNYLQNVQSLTGCLLGLSQSFSYSPQSVVQCWNQIYIFSFFLKNLLMFKMLHVQCKTIFTKCYFCKVREKDCHWAFYDYFGMFCTYGGELGLTEGNRVVSKGQPLRHFPLRPAFE